MKVEAELGTHGRVGEKGDGRERGEDARSTYNAQYMSMSLCDSVGDKETVPSRPNRTTAHTNL